MTTPHVYNLRYPDGHWLARVFITDDGMLSAVSDYGNYGYWWTHTAKEIRRFLLGYCTDSLLAKIAPTMEYDGEATEREVRSEILRLRRVGEMSRDLAREEWDLLREHGHLWCSDDLATWHRETTVDAMDLVKMRPNPQAVGFVRDVWPALCAAIRAEMAKEGVVQ